MKTVFIELTCIGHNRNHPIWINPIHIGHLHWAEGFNGEFPHNDQPAHTKLALTQNGNPLKIKETPEEIIHMIRCNQAG